MSDSALIKAQRAVGAAAEALESASDELCRLDAACGDGDHGLSMAAAARSVRSDLNESPPADIPELVAMVARNFGAVGGSMGALSYVLVSAAGEEAVGEAASSATRISRMLTAAEDAVTSFGGAKPGDKTVVDAIAPARAAAENASRCQDSAADALLAAAAAAEKGAASTAGMIARVGRASRLGERSLGGVDAGATSFAIVLRALAVAYAKETPPATPTDSVPAAAVIRSERQR